MQLDDIDLTDLDTFERGVPHDAFALLRRESPVHWHEEKHGPGFWAITRYDDLRWISKNPRLFSSERKGALMRESSEQDLAIIRNIMLNMDPPKHRNYRGLVNKAFTPRMIENLRASIVEMVKQILNGVVERGECDFVEDVAAHLPLQVICEMMGVPQEDRRRIYEIGNSLVGFDDPEYHEDGTVPDTTDASAAFAEMFMYAGRLREKALREPADDLATGLLNAELDGEKLSETDFNFFFLLLLIAGNETTRTVTSNGMISLLEHPDQLADLRQDPALLNGAVEEILRFAPAVHAFRRQATEEVEIRGRKVREDDKLVLWYPSANRDEDVFPDPHRFDIRRDPNDHVAFGVGEHFCLGANLARLELREIFRGIVDRLHDVEMTEPPRRLRSTFINGVKEMRIRFKPGARVP